jgi:hypothetical protein
LCEVSPLVFRRAQVVGEPLPTIEQLYRKLIRLRGIAISHVAKGEVVPAIYCGEVWREDHFISPKLVVSKAVWGPVDRAAESSGHRVVGTFREMFFERRFLARGEGPLLRSGGVRNVRHRNKNPPFDEPNQPHFVVPESANECGEYHSRWTLFGGSLRRNAHEPCIAGEMIRCYTLASLTRRPLRTPACHTSAGGNTLGVRSVYSARDTERNKPGGGGVGQWPVEEWAESLTSWIKLVPKREGGGGLTRKYVRAAWPKSCSDRTSAACDRGGRNLHKGDSSMREEEGESSV